MEPSRKRTQINDVDRGVYDIKNADVAAYKSDAGLTEDIIRDISREKNEPEWMTEFRLKSLEIFNSKPIPTWGGQIYLN